MTSGSQKSRSERRINLIIINIYIMSKSPIDKNKINKKHHIKYY